MIDQTLSGLEATIVAAIDIAVSLAVLLVTLGVVTLALSFVAWHVLGFMLWALRVRRDGP